MHEIEKYYEIFSLTPEASFSQVKKTYRNMIKKWHPDRYQQFPEVAEEATEKLKEINEAFEAIKNFEGTEEQKKLREILKSKLSYKEYMDIASSYEVSKEKTKPSSSSYKETSYYSEKDWKEKPKKKEGMIFVICMAIVILFILLNVFINIKESSSILNHPSFALGATPSEVIKIQGEPEKQTPTKWIYKNALIYFKDGKVIGYNNESKDLFITLTPLKPLGEGRPEDYYVIGSPKDDIIRIQGTPTTINPFKNEWYYGKSILSFDNDILKGYRNYTGELKARPLIDDGKPPTATLIEKGLSKEDVLKIQGPPDIVEGDSWKYGMAWICFVDNQVKEYYSGNNILHAKL